MVDRYWAWNDLADHLACPCKRSDAWRCANEQRLAGQIACYCPCHKYAFTVKRGETDAG